MSLIRRLISPPETRSASVDALMRAAMSRTASTRSPSQDEAVTLAAVYAAVRLLSETVGSLPIDVFTPGQDFQGRQHRIPGPTPPAVSRPDPTQLPITFWSSTMTSLLLAGNAFWLVVERHPDFGFVTQMRLLDPATVTVKRLDGRIRFRVRHIDVPDGDLIHIPAFMTPGALVGLSPITAFARTLGLAIDAENFGAKWFTEGAAPSSVLETEKPLNADESDELLARWMVAHGDSRTPAVLAGGVKWKAISISPNESQFLETQKWGVEQIARIFGVPPWMIGDVEKTTSWGTGVEAQGIAFVTYTLRPWLIRLEQTISTELLNGQKFARFNADALLRGDTLTRYRAHMMARQGGWRSVNEIRLIEDECPIDDPAGDDYAQPLNLGPLGYDPSQKEGP